MKNRRHCPVFQTRILGPASSDRTACPDMIQSQGPRRVQCTPCGFARKRHPWRQLLRYRAPRTYVRKKQISSLYNCLAGNANGAGHPISPEVGSSDAQARQGTIAWCARGRARACRCGNTFGPNSRLRVLMSGLSGSITSPLTINGAKINGSE